MEVLPAPLDRFPAEPTETQEQRERRQRKKREYQRRFRQGRKERESAALPGVLLQRLRRLTSQRERQRRYIESDKDTRLADQRERQKRYTLNNRDRQRGRQLGFVDNRDSHRYSQKERQKRYFERLFSDRSVNSPALYEAPAPPSYEDTIKAKLNYTAVVEGTNDEADRSAPGAKNRNCTPEPPALYVNADITKQNVPPSDGSEPQSAPTMEQKSAWYTTCSYADCANSRAKTSLSFHKFPTGDPDRCDEWIRNAGNPSLVELNLHQLQSRVLCEKHFSRDSFRDPNAHKKYLLWNAVPLRCETVDVIMPKKAAKPAVVVESRPSSQRAASREAIKQLQMLSQSEGEDEPETLEILSDDEVIAVEPEKKKYRVCNRKSSDGNERNILVLKSLSAGEPTLTLESWNEELSPVQQGLQNRSKKEYKEMMDKIDAVLKAAGAEVIYEGSSFSAFHMEGPPTMTSTPQIAATSTASPDPIKVAPAISKASASKPAPVVANLVSSALANNQNAVGSGYSLVVDPRSGQVVGTVTPATQSLLKSTLNSPVTRKRGRVTSVTPAVPAPPSKIAKVTNSAPPPPLVSLRPAEANAVGGLQPNGSPPVKIVAPAVVDLTSDDGKSSADTKEVSFNKLQGKTFPSLVVVARPSLKVPAVAPTADRAKLDAKVKSVLMHPPTKFSEWLIQQGLVRSEQNCPSHSANKLKLGMYSDVSKFPFSGGYVWISECCPHKFVSVFAGSIFESSPHPPSVILKLVYHWCCQTNVQNVTQWVKVENLYVKGLNTWLRAVCTVALHTHIPQLGGPGVKVEIGVISLGTTSQDGHQRQVKVEVLGILETVSKKIRLRAVEPLSDDDRNYKKRFSKILEPLSPWVHPNSIIVTDLTVDKNTLHSMGFLNIQQSTSGGGNNLIMDYLRRIVPRMFQNTLSLLSRQIIQQFLDELVWREWFGTKPSDAFDNIITHLTQQTRSENGQSLIVRLNKIATNPFKNWTINAQPQAQLLVESNTKTSIDLPKRQRRKQTIVRAASPSIPELLKPVKPIIPDVPDEMVPLEHYYYGTINGVNPLENVPFNVKCHICKSPFTNNIALMKHYYVHAHNNSVDHQCHYCLAGVASKEMLDLHIAQKHPVETKCGNEFVCVICESRFNTSYLLGKHMSLLHVPSELPYQCGSCTYRCSSHRQAVDHFYTVHLDQGVLQCPFCLKTTTIVTKFRGMPQHVHFYLHHLQKHQRKALAKKCSKCQLWFIQKDGVKDHMKMHETQRRKAGLKPWDVVSQGINVPKSINDFIIEEEIDISNLEFELPENSNCKECNKKLTTTHYQSVHTCTNENCQFVTCCKKAMDKHIEACKNFKLTLPQMELPFEMFCVCGHSDKDGNSMAKHLAVCERNSAYPSVQAAKDATITHSMLDVLGLVRRPEEAPMQVDSGSDSDANKVASDFGKVPVKRKGSVEETPCVIELDDAENNAVLSEKDAVKMDDTSTDDAKVKTKGAKKDTETPRRLRRTDRNKSKSAESKESGEDEPMDTSTVSEDETQDRRVRRTDRNKSKSAQSKESAEDEPMDKRVRRTDRNKSKCAESKESAKDEPMDASTVSEDESQETAKSVEAECVKNIDAEESENPEAMEAESNKTPEYADAETPDDEAADTVEDTENETLDDVETETSKSPLARDVERTKSPVIVEAETSKSPLMHEAQTSKSPVIEGAATSKSPEVDEGILAEAETPELNETSDDVEPDVVETAAAKSSESPASVESESNELSGTTEADNNNSSKENEDSEESIPETTQHKHHPGRSKSIDDDNEKVKCSEKIQSSECDGLPVLFNETESPLLPVLGKHCSDVPPTLDSENLDQIFSGTQVKMNDQILENDMDGLLNNIMDSAECQTGNDISEIIAN